MQPKITIDYSQALDFLKELNLDKTRRLLNPSLREGAKPIVETAKKLAPVARRRVIEWFGKRRTINPGVLRASIGILYPKKESKNVGFVFVGPITKNKRKKGANPNNTDDPWYRHFVIHGTDGYTVKRGKMKGRKFRGQEGKPFMDKAMEVTSGTFATGLEKALIRRVSTYARKHNITVN